MSKIENKILTDLVYDKLKGMIDEGVLSPGQKINKLELSQMLGVSQTPINDALSRLAGEKYLEQRSRQGYFVRAFSDEELVALFEMRGALEGMAIRLCCENATPEQIEELAHCFEGFSFPLNEHTYQDYVHADKTFHEKVIRYSGNPILLELSRTSGYMIKSNMKGLTRPPAETYPEHLAMVQALKERNGEKAQQLMIQHHFRSRNVFRSKLKRKETVTR
ncbi:MAG: GntR family transcriptional regulator [Spirochaetales bacterium]